IVQKYVDPANKVQSYSECPRFSDCFYHGEFKTVLISDVLVEYPWINDKPELKAQLEYSCDNWYNYHSIAQDQRIKGTTNLLYFTYKTTRVRPKKIKEKGTGEKILSEADESFDETNITKNDFKRLDKKVEEIEFQGVYVLGTDIILKWEVAENMIRPKSNKQQIISQYIGSAPNREGTYIDSLVARMMPIDDELQIVRLKNCQMIQRMIPDGYFFDIDAFISIDLGTGEVKPQELFDMLFQTGSTMGRSYSSDGNYNAAKLPVSELRMPGNIDKINQLRLEREFNFNLLREVIGLNNASDASSPEKDSLVGIQKLAAANSNVATRDILHGTNDITLRMAQASFCRVSDVLKYSELKEDLIQKIGATATLDIESVKDLHLSDFAIFLELDLDDDERAQLEADLSREIDKGFIDTSDKYTILGIRNFKTAVQYLAILKKKKQKEQEAIKMREIQAQTKANIESAQSAEQAKQQTAQLEGQIKSQVQQAITQGELEKEKIRGEENRKSLEVEYSLKNNLQLLINSGQSEKIHKMESAKDERSLQEATMQGEIAYNKEKGAKPTDFVAENAGLEQFDLTE
ncbi:MAG: hypothetical protein KBC56_09680, partial [Flavobacterium sp.]|nr:hypothetical protein [Flavobacterium sp.]